MKSLSQCRSNESCRTIDVHGRDGVLCEDERVDQSTRINILPFKLLIVIIYFISIT